MRFLLNVIWLVFGGFWLFVNYILAGIVACIFIVTIPAGVASFRIASYVLWPFGKRVVPIPGAGAGSALMNFVWFIIAGLWLAIGHIITAFSRQSPSSVSPWQLLISSSSRSPASPLARW